MAHVTNITELKDRQDFVDQKHIEHAAAVSAKHPNHSALYRHPLKILAPVDTICSDCDEPEFRVRDESLGAVVGLCRDCINATRQLSLVHTHMITHVCLMCELTTDSFGIINGATHRVELPIEDFFAIDRVSGERVRKPGMKSLIGSGLVELDDQATHSVVVGQDIIQNWTLTHHVVHDVDKHCAGCKHVRDPGCPGPGICEGCL